MWTTDAAGACVVGAPAKAYIAPVPANRTIGPIQSVPLAFTVATAAGVGALLLPMASTNPGSARVIDSVFTAVSAICVTGLTIVDTPTHWTTFGHVVIMLLIQLGGIGVMTFATVVGLGVLGRISLRARLTAATEVKSEGLSNLKELIFQILRITLIIEGSISVLLAGRLALAYHYPLGKALWYGVFHAVSSFNNAGFALYSDNLMGFVGDPWICLPISAGIILGGVGFPVFIQLRAHLFQVLRWSMNTRLVLVMTVLLLLVGTIYITVLEWRNPATLGPLAWDDKLLAGFFQSVQTRTAGFNSIDIGKMYPGTWIGMDMLMFVGAGPAGTAGGIKVTTFAVLFFIAWTEIRGDDAVNIMGKRLARSVHRQAITVTMLALAIVLFITTVIVLISPFNLEPVLFECLSAFGTVGLSTGITAQIGTASQLLLCLLMYLGRLGPISFATALALRPRKRLYELPRERPIIG